MARSKYTKSSRFKKKSIKIHDSWSKKKIEKRKNGKQFHQSESINQVDNNIVKIEEDDISPEESCQPLDLLLSTFSKYGKQTKIKSSDFTEVLCPRDELPIHEEMVRNKETDVALKSTVTVNNERNYTEDFEMSESLSEDEDKSVRTENANAVTEVDCESDFNDLTDPFTLHFCFDLNTSVVEAVTSHSPKIKSTSLCWPKLKNLQVEILNAEDDKKVPECKNYNIEGEKNYAKLSEEPNLIDQLNWNKLHVKMQIQNNICKANKKQLNENKHEELTPLQKEVFSIINNYQDLFYPERDTVNGEEIRFVYCLHVVNHILKTRSKILHHNEKLVKKSDGQVPDEYRDQGLVRPKVVIIVPFKESCLRIVNMISSILITEDKGNIINKIRFQEEFSGSELIIPKKNVKPEDYEQLFKGNIDDKFTIGVSFTKKSLKLYSDFYSSDLIIASPLGLRLVVGAEGDPNRDYDFLASVEILILDQAELFLMQNWDHLLLIFEHLHMQPKESHGTDFSRIRSWVLNGWSKFYRQTLIFSSIVTPEINAIFNRRCLNYNGKVRIVNPVECGSISLVVVQMSHIFQKFKTDSALTACDDRFKFLVEKVLPQYKDPGLNGILIYVPSYFDYVRIRNYLKREDYGFVQICEYSKDHRIARARDKFFHNDARFLLYSERFHFFRRIKLKGIRHIIFYQLPTFPHFYSELCNLIKLTDKNQLCDWNPSALTIYCKYDIHQLSSIVKTSRASKLLSSEKDVHMFTTG